MPDVKKLFSNPVFLLIVVVSAGALAFVAVNSKPAPKPPKQRMGQGAPENIDALTGYRPQPEKTKRFLESLPRPTIRDANPDLFKVRDRKPVFLYRALYEAHKKKFGTDWVVGKQGIGDCVSWAWAHGADIHLAVLHKLGESSEWLPAATEAIYGGSRVEADGGSFGGWSDGSYGGAAAKWVRDWGILFRIKYDTVDLTTYSAQRAKQWGAYGCGGQGDDGKLDAVAKKHPVRHVALVRNFEEAAAAILSGYPVPVCSGQGFSSQRDKDGFSRAQGSWSHAMCFIGVRFEPRPGLLCLNSWGASWISGPKFPEDQPDGSFWVDADVASRMLSGKDSFAVSGIAGFPFRDLDNGDWVMVEPKEIKEYYVRLNRATKVDSGRAPVVFALAP